jgi:hypothetical protein
VPSSDCERDLVAAIVEVDEMPAGSDVIGLSSRYRE